jgi:hypothetical protein
MKHIVCFSGGHSSALVAIEVVRRYTSQDVVLLNHDINGWVEDEDIKRFKREVAAHLNLPIIYANYKGMETPPDQFKICVDGAAFKVRHDAVLCTSRLKTEPFTAWLAEHAPPGTATIYYGFDANETARIQRRASILGAKGYATAFPLAHWQRTIQSTNEIGVAPPLSYGVWKHANCIGCIKGRKQHWYAVYVHRPDVWAKAKWAEDQIGYSIQPEIYLDDLEVTFQAMKDAGVVATEHVKPARFWVDAKRLVKGKTLEKVSQCEVSDTNAKPCECTEG